MTIHEEIKDLEHYTDLTYEEAKRIFLNTFLGIGMELSRQLRLAQKASAIKSWKKANKRKVKFSRLKNRVRGNNNDR